MKNWKWIAVVGLVLVIAFSLYQAVEQGEKSPIYAAGTIELSPELASDAAGVHTLFLIIHDMDSPMPMPYGAVKENLSADLQSRIPFLITKEKLQIMNPDSPAPRHLKVKVRLDKDGIAGADQPGDLVGIMENVQFGEEQASIRIDRKIQ